MENLSTDRKNQLSTTRRKVITGIGAIIAAQTCPAVIRKSMIAARQLFLGRGAGGGGDDWWGLKFVALSPSTVGWVHGASSPSVSLLESRDGGKSWNNFTAGNPVSLSTGESMCVKSGDGGNYSMAQTNTTEEYCNRFVLSGEVSAHGDVRSVLNGEEPVSSLNPYALCGLFMDNNGSSDGLVSAPECRADYVSTCSFAKMFYNCKNLVSAPTDLTYIGSTDNVLPTFLYSMMFSGCSSLVNAPKAIGSDACPTEAHTCRAMFSDCTSLRRSPVIKFLNTSGLMGMARMFDGASLLSDIEVTFTSFGAGTSNWVRGVAATGTFRCPSALGTDATIKRATNRCPVGWTVINTD